VPRTASLAEAGGEPSPPIEFLRLLNFQKKSISSILSLPLILRYFEK
jgi:hypothetical protein